MDVLNMSLSKGYDSQGNIFIFSVAPQILKAKEKIQYILETREQVCMSKKERQAVRHTEIQIREKEQRQRPNQRVSLHEEQGLLARRLSFLANQVSTTILISCPFPPPLLSSMSKYYSPFCIYVTRMLAQNVRTTTYTPLLMFFSWKRQRERNPKLYNAITYIHPCRHGRIQNSSWGGRGGNAPIAPLPNTLGFFQQGSYPSQMTTRILSTEIRGV